MKRFIILMGAFLLTGQAHLTATMSYSNAVNAGNYLYISGQFPIDPSTGKISTGNMHTLTNLALDQVQHWLTVNGFTMNQVVATQVYLTDIRDYNMMDAAYAARFAISVPPTRDVIAVPSLLNNSRIEISCIACKSKQ